MGSCLCVNANQGDIYIIQEKLNQADIINEVSQDDPKLKSDIDLSKSVLKTGRRSRRPTKNLSCDQYWEDVRRDNKIQTLFAKSADSKLNDKPMLTLPRVMTYHTNSKYAISICEVVDKIIDPNEVFYFENKDIRPRSPRPSENNKNKPKSSVHSDEIDKKITESIMHNKSFDKLYEEVLSKHLCKK